MKVIKKLDLFYRKITRRTFLEQSRSLFMVFLLLFCVTELIGQPTITSFSPVNGSVGTSVTITGTNFNTSPSENIVYFGAMSGTVTDASATELTVLVPYGATYEPISVLNKETALLAYSASPFVVTFDDGAFSTNTFSFDKDLPIEGTDPYSLLSSDLDMDGKPDLIVANYSSSSISVYRNETSGIENISFGQRQDFSTASVPYHVLARDFDGDGLPDIAVVNQGDDIVSIFRNNSTQTGVITLATPVSFGTGLSPRKMDAGDFDGDGKIDLAIANDGGNSVSILRNSGSGVGNVNFESKIDIAVGTGPYDVAVGDLDGDSKPDIVVVNESSNNVSVFRNTSLSMGSIDFSSPQFFSVGSSPRSISLADLDGDLKLDMIVPNTSSETISILQNTSTGLGIIDFKAKTDIISGAYSTYVEIGDINGDGLVDIVVEDEGICLFQNTKIQTGAVSFNSKVEVFTGNYPRALCLADFDLDGKMDMAVGKAGERVISLYRNRSTDNIVSSATDFLSFSLSEQASQVIINISTHTINIDVLASANVSSLIPTFILSPGATAQIGSIDQVSATTPNDFTNSVTYTITAEDEITTQDWLVTVTLSKNSATDFLSFSLPEQTSQAIINTTTYTIDINVLASANVSSLIPTFILSPGATAQIGSIDQVSATTPNDFTNPVTYTITAEDGITTQDWIVTVIKGVDEIAPVISGVTTETTHLTGSGTHSLSATVTDNATLSSVKVYFKKLTDSLFTSVEMIIDEGKYQHDFKDADFDELGLQFYLEATDHSNNSRVSDQIIISTISVDDVESIPGLKSSKNQLDYSLISIPYLSKNVSSVLANHGAFDDKEWRLAHNSGGSDYEYYPTDFTNFDPGKGYWFLTSRPSDFTLKGGTSVLATNEMPFIISLRAGEWNMIGNPYPFSINWEAVFVHNASNGVNIQPLVKFKDRAYHSSQTLLSKCQGALIYSSEAVEIEIPTAAKSNASARLTQHRKDDVVRFESKWEFGLSLQNDLMQYHISTVGMREGAVSGKDIFDWPLLPRLSEYLDISFTSEITKSIVAPTDQYTWDFTVNTNQKNQQTKLTWDSTVFKKSEMTMRLLDIENQTLVEMEKTSEYSFKTYSEKMPFQLIYGRKDQINNYLNPEKNYLVNPYPNPFDSEITVPVTINMDHTDIEISIYNLLGKLVHQSYIYDQLKGYHEIIMENLSNDLHSGTYFMQVNIKSNQGKNLFNKRIVYNN